MTDLTTKITKKMTTTPTNLMTTKKMMTMKKMMTTTTKKKMTTMMMMLKTMRMVLRHETNGMAMRIVHFVKRRRHRILLPCHNSKAHLD